LGTWKNQKQFRVRPIPLSISPLKGEANAFSPLQGEDKGGDGSNYYNGISVFPESLMTKLEDTVYYLTYWKVLIA